MRDQVKAAFSAQESVVGKFGNQNNGPFSQLLFYMFWAFRFMHIKGDIAARSPGQSLVGSHEVGNRHLDHARSGFKCRQLHSRV